MPGLARLTFVALTGDTPPGVSFDRIPDPRDVQSVVLAAFEGFLDDGGDVTSWSGRGTVDAPADGLHLVYVYGHAWLVDANVETAWPADGESIRGRGSDAMALWVSVASAGRTILVLDCCHAAAFDAALAGGPAPLLIVYASAEDESAIALPADRSSRLSLAFAKELARAETVDLARVVSNIADRLDKDDVILGQTVSYRMSGPAVRLRRAAPGKPVGRERTVSRVRSRLVAAGAIVAVLSGAGAWYYWAHVIVDIDLAGLPGLAKDVVVVASEEEPNANSSIPFARQAANGGSRVRLWAPAGDVILRVQARYADGAERALSFHLNLQRSFDVKVKLVSLALPSALDVGAHPNMAFVPAVRWMQGRDNEARQSERSFWIDLSPPTVETYELMARQMLAAGVLKPDNSFVLSARERSAAIDATGLGQLRTLNKSLGDVFGVVAAANSEHVEAPGDIVVGAGALPCDKCPAPMTRFEAGLYCEARHMRLPTDLEWELAVRGVDGRVYPWGNRFDPTKANVPGLPQKGDPPPALKPVDAYKPERSPFGLWDTVGNAGDWVTNATGSYERVYMGATYRFNPEDATAFRMLPVTDEDSMVREITARCVADDTAAGSGR